MVSLETIQATSRSIEPTTSPRISFSGDFLVEKKIITANSESSPKSPHNKGRGKSHNVEFEFLSNGVATDTTMLTADELFFEGKLLPFVQTEQVEKLNKITLKTEEQVMEKKEEDKEESSRSVNWFIDEDPSPRPPTCTVLWKELLNLKKHRAASSLSPSSSTSSSSSGSTGELESIDEGKEGKEGMWNREKHVKRIKKGLERTRSASFRIRPVVNVPICTQGKHTALPPLFSFKKANVERCGSILDLDLNMLSVSPTYFNTPPEAGHVDADEMCSLKEILKSNLVLSSETANGSTRGVMIVEFWMLLDKILDDSCMKKS